MAFKPCIIIPVYNHHKKFNNVVDQLRPLQIPCFVIDDGSDSACQQALNAINEKEPWMTLIRLDPNQGKGAAVCKGFRTAHEQGFSHALQVDSDGQHDLKDVPKFIETAKQHPQALIAGARSYQAMPKNRRYGRFITDFWVWINTLSTNIKDSMCGYRLYPLDQTIALLNKTNIGRRMDFDTDIMVRLYWDNIELVQIDTAVVYQDEIVSHFDLVKDNIRISKMHTKLFFGMLVRLPGIVIQRLKRKLAHA